MPIYSYRCDHCGHQQDVLQKMSDPLLVTCPVCGEAAYRKQVTAAGFQLKGSGWYVTDFKNPPAKESTKTTKPEADASGTKGETSGTEPASTPASDSTAAKPAPATESKSAVAAPKPPPAPSGGTP